MVGCSSRLTKVSQCSITERTRESSPKGLLLSSITPPGGGRARVAGGRTFPMGLQKCRVFLVTYMAVANLTG